MGDNPEDATDSKVDVNLDSADDEATADDEFDHPDDVPVTDPDEIPEIDSAEDAVDGDNERLERLQNKAKEMQEESEEATEGEEEAEEMVPETSDGTPVNLGEDIPETASDGGATASEILEENTDTETPDEDNVSQASDSLFTDEEAEQVEAEYGEDFELETLDDIPDDFDYEDQDTTHYGAEQEANIKHNGVVFKLAQPEGAKEDKFWSEIQQKETLAGIFDALIKYGVDRPRDIESRMEEENWTGFAKAGLAMKISSFLGLDSLQDF